MNQYQRGTFFRGCLNIRPTRSFEETAEILSKALGIAFLLDQSGKYEEFPAYRAFALGLELALLAPPSPEDDLREVKDENFQLLVQTRVQVHEPGVNVDISALLEEQIQKSTTLITERLEHINAL